MMSETVPFDDRAKAYLRSGDVAVGIATEHFGIEVDHTTRQRWREMMGLLREVDTMADDTDVTHPEVLAHLADFTLFETRYPHLSPASLGPEVHTAMLRRTEHILKLGNYASETTSLHRFVALRALEGRQSVELFGDCATPTVAVQPEFRDGFLPGLGALAASATLWDSLIDGCADMKEGKQQVQPNVAYYRAVAGAMLHSARGNLRILMHPEPIYQGSMKFVDRVVNRVRNGIPSYSNLHRFTRK